MKRTGKLFKIIPLVAAFNSLPAMAESPAARCVADLGRIDANVCLSAAGTALTYKWQANDASFALVANACVTNSNGLGNRRDTVFALDRSQNIQAADVVAKKTGADQITSLKASLDTLRAEAKADPTKAAKIGVMMFSTDAACAAYTGGTIAVNRTFPCLFVAAASLADDRQYNLLSSFLKEATGKYAQSGQAASDLGIVATQAAANAFGLANAHKSGLIIMSDARSFKAAASTLYPELRVQDYTTAQNDILNAFSVPALKGYELMFALSPVKAPFYDDAGAYDTMCALADAAPADCKAPVAIDDARTWPVNKLDFRAFVASIAAAMASPAATASFDLADNTSLASALSKMRITDTGMSVSSVSYRINGGAAQAGTVDGARLTIPGLPVGQNSKLEIIMKTGTADVTVPVDITTEKVASTGAAFQDKEMFCAAPVDAASAGPRLRLKDLQGGSGSCGAIPGAETGAKTSPFGVIALLLAPLAAVLFRKKYRVAPAAVLAAVAFTGNAQADEAKGLNTLNYRPVVDGIATTEKAGIPASGQFNAGLYMDYANDAVELSADKGKRVGSVADNLVTAHVAANVGLFGKTALGVHLPLVYKTDLSRRVDGQAGNGEKSGELSDPTVTLKYTISTQRLFTLGVMPMATIPTGKPEDLTGDGVATFGGLFLISGSRGNLGWAANLGYMHRQKALVLADDRAHDVSIKGQFQAMLGADYKVLPILSLGGGLQFKPAYGERIDFTRANPAEWTMVAKFRPVGGALETQAGFGTGIGKGVGAPDYRVYAGVSYVPGAPVQVATRK